MNNQPIGIFDSGLGGLTVLREIARLLPQESFIYIADQVNFSYGLRSKKELEVITAKLVNFLVNKNVKLVVVACNTATVQTLKSLRRKFKIPIIGTVPVVKAIASISSTKKVAVFATPSTVNSIYLSDLIKKYANNVKVYKISGIDLEQLIEQGNFDSKQIVGKLKKPLGRLSKIGVDAVALGCTHYPLIKTEIQEILGPKIAVLDSGGAVARRVKTVLENENLLSNKKTEDTYYTSSDVKKFKRMLKSLLKKEVTNVFGLKL